MQRKAQRKTQQGFALVASVFLIVILAMAATFMARFASTGYAGQAQQIIVTRARQAALSAVEYGIHQAAVNGICLASSPITVSAYSGFAITTECNTETYLGGITIYRITGTASHGSLGQPEYVWRQYHASLEL